MIESLCQDDHWHKLDKERAHGYRDKGKNRELMSNLVPSQNHERNIDGIKGYRYRGNETKPVVTKGRYNLGQTCRTT